MYLRYQSSWDAGEVTGARPRRRGTGAASVMTRQQRAALSAGSAGPGAPARLLPVVDLMGVRLHAITEIECIRHILDNLDAGRGGVVVTPNLDHLRRYTNDVNFGALVAEADLCVADGMPLVWASRIQGTPLPERVAGSNLISSLSAAAGERKRSVYLLGGSAGTAEGASQVLVARYPNLRIAGWYFPPVGFDADPKQMEAIIASLAAAQPDIVYVALGSPKQERLIAKLKPILPNAWWLGVGNSFSFLCGDVRRAPLWMQRTGLEWCHRLVQEPRRLFKRYVMVGMPFASKLLWRSFVQGMATRVRRKLTPAPLPAAVPTVLVPGPIAPAGAPMGASPASDGLLAEGQLGIAAPLVAQLARGVWPGGAAPESERPTSNDDDAAVTPAPLSRLRAMVLLGGSVRANALSAATGRSVLDLPLDESGSILNFWLGQAVELARMAGLERLPVRVMVNQLSPEPRSADPKYLGSWRVERDLSEYRGTGGVLRDIANDYQDDDLILVANAAQVLLDPLPLVVTALLRKRGDVAVISHEDGTPSGIQLVTCKTLRLLAATGFVDMKEQGLPLIASKFDVRVLRRRRPTGLPIRSLEGYIQALHYYHRRRAGKPTITDPLAEDWSPVFSLVEPGATVDVSARVHDSVVLAGGCVEPGAVLVRSVVCPGAIVRRDRTAVEQLLTQDQTSRTPRAFRAAAACTEVAVPKTASKT